MRSERLLYQLSYTSGSSNTERALTTVWAAENSWVEARAVAERKCLSRTRLPPALPASVFQALGLKTCATAAWHIYLFTVSVYA